MPKKTDHPGRKPEGFMRDQLTLQDIAQLLEEIQNGVASHFEHYGSGIFCHPHEVVGCMYGQLKKLSEAAYASIHTGELDDFRERCWKTLMAILVGVASTDKLATLREMERESAEEPAIGTRPVHSLLAELDSLSETTKRAVMRDLAKVLGAGPLKNPPSRPGKGIHIGGNACPSCHFEGGHYPDCQYENFKEHKQ
jgi:hypothetical protein